MPGLNFLKKFFPLGWLYHIRFLQAPFRQNKLSDFSKKKKILYLDSPDYGNLGDQAIAYAIKKYAEKNFPEYEFVELFYNETPFYLRFLKYNISQEDIIFLTGGGNMGNIYRMFEAVRRKVIKSFPENKIVVFPQTIDYTDSFFGKLSFSASRRIYASHRKLVLCAREEESFAIIKSAYPKNQVLSCSDIVLSMDALEYSKERMGCGVCLRDDCESVLTIEDKKQISDTISKYFEISQKLTTEENGKIGKNDRHEVLGKKLKEFSECKLVVTDRLHAMIFCAITHTPCIALENSNQKIRGVYKHIQDLDYIVLLKTVDALDRTIRSLSNAGVERNFHPLDFKIITDAVQGAVR